MDELWTFVFFFPWFEATVKFNASDRGPKEVSFTGDADEHLVSNNAHV